MFDKESRQVIIELGRRAIAEPIWPRNFQKTLLDSFMFNKFGLLNFKQESYENIYHQELTSDPTYWESLFKHPHE